MKIVHVITSIRKSAGTTTFVVQVAEEQVRQGHDVTIAVVGGLNANSESTAVRVIVIGDLLAGEERFDLAQLHGLWEFSMHYAAVWAKRHGIPVVWSPHGNLAPWAMKHHWWKKCIFWYLWYRWDIRRAKFIHVTSELERTWVRNLGFTQPIIQAPLGTCLPKANKVEKLGGGGERKDKILLFVGRVYPVKALDRMIEAFAKARVAGWKLRIVGPDQDGHLAELISLCNRLGLSYSDKNGTIHCSTSNLQSSTSTRPPVEFPGPLHGPDLEQEYANCDILALVSHTENFGATVIDAMAHGKPVITSTKTPWREVVERGCGWCVENDVETLAKTIREAAALSDAELSAMGARGQQLVEDKYTWRAIVQRMMEEVR